MQRKQEAAIRRKGEAADNIAPRQTPALVQRIESRDGETMQIVCEADDWNRMTKVRTEKRILGS